MLPYRYQAGRATVWALPTQRFKAGLLSVSAAMPITRENACLGPLMLSVLRRGTCKYPALADVNRRLEYLWGTGLSLRTHYRGNRLVLGLSADLLDPRFLPARMSGLTEGVLDLMCEILGHPALDPDGLLRASYVESEKALQCDAICAVKNNPRAYAVMRADALLYEGEPRGLPLYGTEEQTLSVTREELTAYWRRWRESLCPDCFYVGPAEPGEISGMLMAAFGAAPPADVGLPAGDAAGEPGSPAPGQAAHKGAEAAPGPAAPGESASGEAVPGKAAPGEAVTGVPASGQAAPAPRRVCETAQAEQSQLIIGLRGAPRLGEPGYYACAVAEELLGGSPISRLFTYVREKRSLCYSCSSAYASLCGTVTVSCGLSAGNRAEAEAEIFRQLDALRQGDFTAAELDAARKSLLLAYRQTEDSPAGLESYYHTRALAGCPATLRECREALAAVTAGEVMQAAARLRPALVYFLEGTRTGGAGEEGADDDDDADL